MFQHSSRGFIDFSSISSHFFILPSQGLFDPCFPGSLIGGFDHSEVLLNDIWRTSPVVIFRLAVGDPATVHIEIWTFSVFQCVMREVYCGRCCLCSSFCIP